MVHLFTDPVFLKHETGQHPERAARLRAVADLLTKAGLVEKCQAGKYKPLSAEVLQQIHSAEQVRLVQSLAEKGGGRIDADTIMSAESFDVGRSAAGACVAAVDAVINGDDRRALCLVRPPGHHANQTTSMGFCLFNNIALAARHALSTHKLSRVLIVDWDVHHGNGTQDIFYEDPAVTFFSIHRYGHGFYPGTGAESETGSGKGLAHTLNTCIRYGSPRRDYHAKFTATLEKAADKSKPELVLISAGFDAHRKDPIGSLDLETEDFATLTNQVLDVAKTHAKGRIVSCLEGGYHLEALADSVKVHLEHLLAS